jgi:pSer/pThr/pTyr-binding forkhead associated (FHA) protein
MEHTCPVCNAPYDGIFCTACTTAVSEQEGIKESAEGDSGNSEEKAATAFLVDLVSNRKIPVSVPRCKAGRDDLNDIVITGDQSISRFHFVLTQENGQYYVQDNKSRHGTFLNGNQIGAVEPINDGDVLKVGVSLFWFVIEAPATAQDGLEPMPVDLTERPAGLPALSAKDLPMQGELRISKPGTKRRMPDPNMTATSDSIPALSPDATLADYLGAKTPSKPVTPAFEEKTLPPSQFDATFVAPPPSATSEFTAKPVPQPTDIRAKLRKKQEAAEAERAAQQAAESEPVTNESLLNPLELEMEEPLASKPTEEVDEEQARPAQAAEVSPAHPEDTTAVSSATMEKFAGIIEEMAAQSDVVSEIERHNVEMTEELAGIVKEGIEPTASGNQGGKGNVNLEQILVEGLGNASGNGAKSAMSMVKEQTPGTVPAWCDKYFAGEINQMSRELADLNELIRQTQQRIKDVENRMAQLKALRNTMLTGQGDELVEACGKILIFLGWRVKISDDDRQELKLEAEDRLSIARVVWTTTQAERTHLGQLSISQTRYWCEIGSEPKGILIVSRLSDQPPAPLSQMDYNSELADFATKKNVCLMTTLQLLSIYREIAFNSVNPEQLRGTVSNTNGWLQGFNLETATGGGEQAEGGTNKFSSLLSAS